MIQVEVATQRTVIDCLDIWELAEIFHRFCMTVWPWRQMDVSTLQCFPVVRHWKLRDHGIADYVHCVSKAFPPLNSLQLCQILTDFHNFCTAGKHIKFATKPIRQYPSHLRHATTLPWEINFLQIRKKIQTNCIFIAFNFVIDPQVLIFWCLV